MKEDLYDDLYLEEKEEKTDFKAILFKYAIHWPWFVACTLLCIAGAWLYLRYTPPVYNISASVIIKDNDKNSKASSGMGDLEDLGFYSSINNFDNEVEILQSRTLIKKVVEELDLYISYATKSSFHDIELYKSSPVKVWITPEEAQKLPAPARLHLTLQPGNKLNVKLRIGEEEYNKQFDKLPALLTTPSGTFSFTPKDSATVQSTQEIMATVSSPRSVANAYRGALSIEPTSKSTTIAQISVKSTHTQRGMDFINKLVEVYNRDANDDKNEVATKTAEFIDERIKIINGELGTTEQELETFKRDAGLTDLKSDAQLALSENSEYEKKRVENQTQINLVVDLQKYLQGNEYEVLPANVGLQDGGLVGAISRYNEMLIERNRLLRTSTESNPAIVNLNTSIRAMRSNVQATLDATLKGLQITKADLDREASRYSRRISDAPTQERQFVSIARQQEIKSGLYLMLLQKREENAITLAATANNAQIIDAAIADDNPISPKRMKIYLVALLFGMGIPVGIIYLIGLTKFKIEGRADIEKLTSLPVVGDIPLADEKSGSIAVFENQNNLMSETFRNVRTNLQFMLERDKNVILIVGLDIRKPGLNKVFNIPKKDHGITQFLTNPSMNLMDLVQPSDINRNLFILPGGAVPPNPTELLARDGLEKAIETLKTNFDYVILDTAPVGMVTDTLLIGRTADLSVYVCRADYTRKAEFTLVNELSENNKLPNLSIAINGLDLQKKKYGYYHGYGKYGKYYGYGKRYGYGYGKENELIIDITNKK